MDGTNMPISSLLEQAAYVVRRKKETTGTLGETESHKRGQIEALISFANENQLWFSCSEKNLCYFSKGGENEVYANDSELIFKLNNFEYAGDDLENFFIRISAHNKFFKNVPYSMIGFEMDYADEFHNDEYEIFDAVPNNVLYGIDGDLYFIDTQIRLR